MCVAAKSDLNDLPCSNKNSFVCEIGNLIVLLKKKLKFQETKVCLNTNCKLV